MAIYAGSGRPCLTRHTVAHAESFPLHTVRQLLCCPMVTTIAVRYGRFASQCEAQMRFQDPISNRRASFLYCGETSAKTASSRLFDQATELIDVGRAGGSPSAWAG